MDQFIKLLAMLLMSMSPAWGNTTDVNKPRVAQEHIVFSTLYGPLLFALYPDVAPKHVEQILTLVRAGAYNTTHFFRVIPGFIAQVSLVDDRTRPLSAQQKALVKSIDAEFSHIPHTKSKLSMARWENDVNSATSSFSIMLGNAPHLDSNYTVFGHLESGGSVVNKILTTPLIKNETPKTRLTINHAYVITDVAKFYEKYLFDPPESIGEIDLAQQAEIMIAEQKKMLSLIAILVMVMVFVGLLGFFLYERISKNRLLSLLLVNVLISGFILLIVFVPIGQENSWVAVVLFLGMFGLFQIMSRFEKNR